MSSDIKNYYELWFSDIEGAMICDAVNLRGINPYFVFDTDPMLQWPKPYPLFAAEGSIQEDYFACTVNGWHLFSQRLVDKLKLLCGKDANFYPVQIDHTEGNQITCSYYVMHVVCVIQALDRSKSQWTPDPDDESKVMSIHHPVLDSRKISGQNVFRLAEADTMVILSEKMFDVINEINSTGFRLNKIDHS